MSVGGESRGFEMDERGRGREWRGGRGGGRRGGKGGWVAFAWGVYYRFEVVCHRFVKGWDRIEVLGGWYGIVW